MKIFDPLSRFMWERHLAANIETFQQADRGKMPLPQISRPRFNFIPESHEIMIPTQMAGITAGPYNVKINVDYWANIVQIYEFKIDAFEGLSNASILGFRSYVLCVRINRQRFLIGQMHAKPKTDSWFE